MSAIEHFLLGKIAVPDHPATPLNPNGREGFIITEVSRDARTKMFAVRGEDTMWFSETCLLAIGSPNT